MAGNGPLRVASFLNYSKIIKTNVFFLVQNSASLPSVRAPESELEANDKAAEETRASVEHFLQVSRFKQKP